MDHLVERRLQQLRAAAEKLTEAAGHQPELTDALRDLEHEIDRIERRRAAQEVLTPRA